MIESSQIIKYKIGQIGDITEKIQTWHTKENKVKCSTKYCLNETCNIEVKLW